MTPLSALLVDPALFTAPYDASLTEGLEHAGVQVTWAARGPREGEEEVLPRRLIAPLYYKGLQEGAKGRGPIWKARKGLSHLQGGMKLLSLAQKGAFDIVHFQWPIIPLYDAMLMRSIARKLPVILTLHDLSPYNGAPTSRIQLLGFRDLMNAATTLIVHTQSARATLIDQGHAPDKIAHIPHGPLRLPQALIHGPVKTMHDPWRVVFFGKLQRYKGIDVLVEALGQIEPTRRRALKVTIAGEPLMPMEELINRAHVLGLDETLEFDCRRLEESEMATLLGQADCFVFPYRNIEASGVFHLVQPLGRWIVATDIGAFKDVILDDRNGRLVPIDAPEALASAILDSIGRAPGIDDAPRLLGWDEIGLKTRAVYEDALVAQGTSK